jgi:hypothetical protein
MTIKTDFFLKVLHVIAWIIFLAVCIEAGGFLFNTIITLFINMDNAKRYWMEADLSALYKYNQSHYVTLTSLMIITAVLRAILFYCIVKLLYDKKLDLAKPFNETTGRFLFNIAYLSLGIGFFSLWGTRFAGNLVKEGVTLPDIQHLRLAGADVWFFMGVTLLVIAFIFKKGIELQNENELTV